MGNIHICKKFVKCLYGSYQLRLMDNSVKEKSKMQDKESLLAMVSHDLKNPVSSGILALKLLQDSKLSPLNPYQQEIVGNMRTALGYMKNLIENVLDRYKLDNEVFNIYKVQTDFNMFVNSVINDSKYIISDKNQTIKLISNLKNPIIELDSLEIQRVINNLLSNSSKYSPENSKITIKLYEQENKIFMSIENAGCKFKLPNPNDIFNKFVSINDNSKSLASGLGLFIVKEIINAHGGDIFVESELNKFTRFTFYLPRK